MLQGSGEKYGSQFRQDETGREGTLIQAEEEHVQRGRRGKERVRRLSGWRTCCLEEPRLQRTRAAWEGPADLGIGWPFCHGHVCEGGLWMALPI